MTLDLRPWRDRVRRIGRSQYTTQAVVLLPVVLIAGVTVWSMVAPWSGARGQSTRDVAAPAIPAQNTSLLESKDTPMGAIQAKAPEAAPGNAPSAEPSPVQGLRISSQSWRRGGLGSNALVTFTLRNNNDYAIKDLEIACAFARKDGSHLTDRTRVIPATVNMKSRKTFAHLHVGFVNINANKAKCTLIAASRI